MMIAPGIRKLANGQSFIGLPDLEKGALTLYGKKISIVELRKAPVRMLVDKTGLVGYGQYEHSMADMPSNYEIVRLPGHE